jgi:aldehyde:ferredoxin oxidoreductase
MIDIPECFHAVIDTINARYGWNWTMEDFYNMGKKILKAERELNKRAGFDSEDDRLPEFFREEKLPPHNQTLLVSSEKLDELFDF